MRMSRMKRDPSRRGALSFNIKIGDESKPQPQIAAPSKKPSVPAGGSKRKQGDNTNTRRGESMQVVFQEPEQEDDEASESN